MREDRENEAGGDLADGHAAALAVAELDAAHCVRDGGVGWMGCVFGGGEDQLLVSRWVVRRFGGFDGGDWRSGLDDGRRSIFMLLSGAKANNAVVLKPCLVMGITMGIGQQLTSDSTHIRNITSCS